MKLRKVIFLFFCFVISFSYCFVFIGDGYIDEGKVYADNINTISKSNSKHRNYIFFYNEQIFRFSSEDYYKTNNVSNIQEKFLEDKKLYRETLFFINKIGLSKKDIVRYLFPEIEYIKEKLCQIIDIYPEDNYIEYVKNSCQIKYIYGKKGLFLNQEDFYNKVYQNVILNRKNINIRVLVNCYENEIDIKNDFQEKSCFSTDFSTSSDSRKNNIKVALESFDGIIINEGETISFNKITGIRNEKNGYQKAKIISGGTFIDGFGGGVCQVSTTLYNACILAGLEIVEVHNHSLPVSYIEPSFDAMVNSGSSDLIVRNNSGGKIIITTSSKNDICKVKIFGKENQYIIKKVSEKKDVILAEKDYIDYDYKKYLEEEFEIGQEKRISYAKDGFTSNGYLLYYDKDDNFIKKEKIRECKYNATKGIIAKRVS